jgi:regulator of replication initiation timing
MMKQAAVARTADVEPIDRLEEKIRRLVALITELREEQSRSADEQTRLAQEIALLRARLADAEASGVELTALRDEREMIRTRVTEMLEQLEGI